MKRINFLLDKLYHEYSFENRYSVDEIGIASAPYKDKDEIPSTEKFSIYKNSHGWGKGADKHYWFVFDVSVPSDYSNYVLSVKTGYNVWHASNPQFIVYIDGSIVQGLDENHTEVVFKKAGQQTVWLYAYTGSEVNEKLNLFVDVVKVRRDVRKLFYQLYVLYEIVSVSDENSRAYKFNKAHLDTALSMLDFLSNKMSESSVAAALKYLDENATGHFDAESTVYCLGQTHIDAEWLWTLAQTKEKVQRSFSNVLNLMDRYKDYPFMQSTPLFYGYIKETQPELHSKILSLVKEGRWEPDGATWVEPDNVLSGGESLIRQILYGKKYYKDEFNKDCQILWLPDCFGFSGAFPQIAKKTGIKWFITSKISWNDTNQFPHDIFEWQGIDGSRINTYFLTTQAKEKNKYTPVTAYNGMANPKQIIGTYDRLTEKDLSDIVLTSYGWGDGGGGPTESMYEQLDFMRKGIVGLPKIKPATLKEFISDLEVKINGKKLPRWVGELYLEYHRGTYTSVAKVKKGNRTIESLLSNVEFLCAVNSDYSKKDVLDRIWKTVLTHQFHDALPGSGIKAIYDDIDKDYKQITDELNAILFEEINLIISRDGLKGDVVVFNFNSQVQSGMISFNGEKYYVKDVPAKGYKTFSLKEIASNRIVSTDYTLENQFYKLTFDENYNIVSLFDKRIDRNIVKNDGLFNVIKAYNDINCDYDGWELNSKFIDTCNVINNVTKVTKISDGTRAGVKIERTFRSSLIIQTIFLDEYNDFIGFETEVDWKEKNIILKTEFDTDIFSNFATYNIQFGNIERSALNNTEYDIAQFEVPFHKYYDISEGNYGISLINDCKYGGSVKDGKMSLSLLKSATYPYLEADKCKHEFSYYLVPHLGDYREADIVNKAYGINNPMVSVGLLGEANDNDAISSFINVDKKNIVIETVKPSEDLHGVVVRLYDSHNVKGKVKISFLKKAKKIVECDMLENEQKVLAENTNSVELYVGNYEIKTIKMIY